MHDVLRQEDQPSLPESGGVDAPPPHLNPKPRWASYGYDYYSKPIASNQGCVWDEKDQLWLYEGDDPPFLHPSARWFPHPLPEGWKVDTYYAMNRLGELVPQEGWTTDDRYNHGAYRVILHQWLEVCWEKPPANQPAHNKNYISNKRALFFTLHRPLTDQEKEDFPERIVRGHQKEEAANQLRDLGSGDLDCLPVEGRFKDLAQDREVHEFGGQGIITGTAWWVILSPGIEDSPARTVWIVDQEEGPSRLNLGPRARPASCRQLPSRLVPEALRLLGLASGPSTEYWKEWLTH